MFPRLMNWEEFPFTTAHGELKWQSNERILKRDRVSVLGFSQRWSTRAYYVIPINRLSINVHFRSLRRACDGTLSSTPRPDSSLDDHLHRLSDFMSSRIGSGREYKIIYGAEYLDKHKEGTKHQNMYVMKRTPESNQVRTY